MQEYAKMAGKYVWDTAAGIGVAAKKVEIKECAKIAHKYAAAAGAGVATKSAEMAEYAKLANKRAWDAAAAAGVVDPETYELTERGKFAGKCAAGAVLGAGMATAAVPLLGFGTAGVGAGTPAAAVHSMIGNVAAGTMFAKLQSAGVLGLAFTTKATAGLGGAAAGAAAHYGTNKD